MSALWNSDASVPNETLPKSCVPLQALAELGDLVAAVRVEAGQRRELIELDMGRRDDTACISGSSVAAKRLTSAKQRIGIVERQVPELEIEAAVARHDVERRAAADHAGVHRRVRARRTRRRSRRDRETRRAMLREERHDFAGDLHRVDAARRQRRMRLVAAHAAAVAFLALVRDDEAACRSARRRCSPLA